MNLRTLHGRMWRSVPVDRRGLNPTFCEALCVGRLWEDRAQPPAAVRRDGRLGGQGSAGGRAPPTRLRGTATPPGARPRLPTSPLPRAGLVGHGAGAAHTPSASRDPGPRAPSPPGGHAHWLPFPLAAAAAGIVLLSLRPEEPREPGPCPWPGAAAAPCPAPASPRRPPSANIPEIKRYAAAAAAAAGPGAGGAGDRGEAVPAAAMEALGPGEERTRAGWASGRDRGSPSSAPARACLGSGRQASGKGTGAPLR